MANKLRVYWPGDQLCHSCFYTAMRTHGICPICGHDGVLPGRANRTDPRSVCLNCAGIPGNFTCRTCKQEGEIYRNGVCARCALRDDLCRILLHHPADSAAMETLIEVLCGVDRPESILTWKRSQKVLELLGGITSGAIPLTHDGLTAAGRGKHIGHLRSILEHHGLLPPRDEHLARFEEWLSTKLDTIASPAVRAPVEQFATWHHLRRLRSESRPGQGSDGPKRSAKQEITETIKFLAWLEDTHGRSAAECTQHDVDAYLNSGPTTRHLIRTFFVWANSSRINTGVQIGFRQARTTPTITQEQRLAWLKELLTGDSESLPYRVAGVLVLLYAQPLTKIAALQSTAISQADGETLIALGKQPIPVPEPFASQLNYHLRHRPNLRTTGGAVGTPWLFPGSRPGWHLDPQTIMHRLRWVGINTLGSRNTALKELVAQVPAPLVAEMLGYSDQVTQKHAAEAGNTWAAYASTAPKRSNVSPPKQQRPAVPDAAHTDVGDQLTLDIIDDDIDDDAPLAGPVQALLDTLDDAATAVTQARAAVDAAEDQLAQAVLHARQSGLSWARVAAALGISPQAAHQRWAARFRNPDEDDGAGSALAID